MRNFVCLGNAKLTQLARNWKQSLIQKYSKRSVAKKFDVTQSRIQEWVKQEMELRNQNALDGSEEGIIHCFKEYGPVPSGREKHCLAREEKEMAVLFQELDLSEEEEKDMNNSDVFIDACTLQRIFLGLNEIRSSHTGCAIRADTEFMLQEFGLEVQSMFKVVTDGGSNMSKVFKDIFKDDRNFHDESDDEELPEAELVVESIELPKEICRTATRSISICQWESRELPMDSHKIPELPAEVQIIGSGTPPSCQTQSMGSIGYLVDFHWPFAGLPLD
uniref:Uncharacterized protein n=1 Tax=Ditylenchus dipsaci TaxID=166011 RepID=A0A915DUJ8_9BILA